MRDTEGFKNTGGPTVGERHRKAFNISLKTSILEVEALNTDKRIRTKRKKTKFTDLVNRIQKKS